jgi:DNA-directed RNA polymerase I, II, and III subunit RPABC2
MADYDSDSSDSSNNSDSSSSSSASSQDNELKSSILKKNSTVNKVIKKIEVDENVDSDDSDNESIILSDDDEELDNLDEELDNLDDDLSDNLSSSSDEDSDNEEKQKTSSKVFNGGSSSSSYNYEGEGGANSDEDNEDDENDDIYFQKFNEDVNKNYIIDNHPECVNINYDEVITLSKVVRDNKNNIIDDLHKTIPKLTKYERARILGQRAMQINTGMTAFVKVPENVIDGYLIAEMELAQKRIPFIIKRPMPGGSCEYWKISDLELIDF